MGSFSIWHWLIVLLVIAMVFGTSKLKNIGKDFGSAIKSFKDGVNSIDPQLDNEPSEMDLKESNVVKK